MFSGTIIRIMHVDFGGPSVIVMAVVVVAGLVLFAKVMIVPLWKQSLEAKHLTELNTGFTFKAGGWFDVVNLTYPFVKVTLGMDSIHIKHSGYDLTVMYNQIKSINAHKGRISNGLKIEYMAAEETSGIIIWTPYYKQVIAYIQSKIGNALVPGTIGVTLK